MNHIQPSHLAVRLALGLVICVSAAVGVLGLARAPAVVADSSPLATPTPVGVAVGPTLAPATALASPWAMVGSALVWVALGAGAGLAILAGVWWWHRRNAP